ncbi:unnamed protein product [Didymodactylos carnosus]|uniref:Thioredoxin domain-containing protein n=1 Tax=Didymodactylos carnosus TaxID=1234261 RepID=A0A813RR75_9BILA|nr:unnamed protein product [Didymodactylos carnosus]CAF0786292.1 unnamed protein product [Didymodactylos carnosus]CAF3511810.1 unnamed protein product [Didymodactylos carnosus]CAF3570071.1 unnamed protein product [Didymodactylos carnosus]
MRSTYRGIRFLFTLARMPKEDIQLLQSKSIHLLPNNSSHLIQQKLQFHTTPQLKSINIFQVQDENDFQKQILDSKKPFIVDFHATWCKPCKVLQPRLEKAIASYNKDVKIDQQVALAKIDIDKCVELSAKYDVQVVPTVLSIKDGKVIDRFSGVVDENKILKVLNKLNK